MDTARRVHYPVPWNIKDVIAFSVLISIYMTIAVLFAKRYFSRFPIDWRLNIFIFFDIFCIIVCFGILKLLLKKYTDGWKCLISGGKSFLPNFPSSAKLAVIVGFASLVLDYYIAPFLFPGLLLKPLPFSFSSLIIYPLVIAPIVEEIWFRSFFYRGIRKIYGFKAGLIVSTSMFALYHYYNFSGLSIILYSILVTIYYEKTNALYNCIFIHSIANLIIILGRSVL